MQCLQSAPCQPMRRDPDSKWVQLARTRRNNPGLMSGNSTPTSTLSTSASSRSITPPNIKDAGHLRSRSSATSYFALLSAAEDANRDGRSHPNQKQHHGRPSSRHMDSLWASWYNCNQRPSTNLSDDMILETPSSSTQPFVNFNHSRAPSETPSLQMSENTIGTTTASSTSSTNPPSTISTSVRATSPLQSSPVAFLDANIDGLNTFPEFSSTFPFDLNDSTTNATFDPAELDAGLLTWLDQQPPLPFGPNDETNTSSPTSKRGLETYPQDSAKAGTISLDHETAKKQKIFHSWTEGVETSLPFSPQW